MFIFSYNSIKTFHWHFQNDYPFNDNISVAFGGPDIPVETYCDPFLANLLINWYQVDFMHGLLQNRQNDLVKSFKSSFCYINDTYTLYLVKLWWFIENKRNCLDKKIAADEQTDYIGIDDSYIEVAIWKFLVNIKNWLIGPQYLTHGFIMIVSNILLILLHFLHTYATLPSTLLEQELRENINQSLL
jgi:hypothetical protein